MKNELNPQTISAFEGSFIKSHNSIKRKTSKFNRLSVFLIPCFSLFVFFVVFVCTCGAAELFVVTTDYETGGSALFNTKGLYASHSEGTIYSDSVARSFEGNIYVVERWHADNILVLRANNLTSPVIQFSVGNGNNPHDFLLINSDKAYITLYEKSYLLIVNPKTGKTTGQIDLSGFSDSDGIPEMDLMVRLEDRVFVSLQKLDRANMFQPATFGQVAVIDCENDVIIDTNPDRSGIQAINLSFGNPYDMQLIPGTDRILVAEAGSFYSQDDGGFEFIDTSSYKADGIILTEADLGGQIGGAFGGLAMISQDEGYAVVMDSGWQTRVVRFNILTRSVVPVHVPNSGFVHAGILVGDGRLFVCDRTMDNPGIRVFDIDNNREITGDPVDTGLPPFCLVCVNGPCTEPLPQGDDNQTSIPPELEECPVEFIFGAEHPVTAKCRSFRDDVLLNFEAGRQAIKIYYIYASEITRLLKSDGGLKKKASLCIKLFFSETAEDCGYAISAVFSEILQDIKENGGFRLTSDFKKVLNLVFFTSDEQRLKH